MEKNKRNMKEKKVETKKKNRKIPPLKANSSSSSFLKVKPDSITELLKNSKNILLPKSFKEEVTQRSSSVGGSLPLHASEESFSESLASEDSEKLEEDYEVGLFDRDFISYDESREEFKNDNEVDETRPETSLTPVERGVVSIQDPLHRYLQELKRYPLLEPGEEFQLALQLKEKGDLGAAKRLITANLRLVVKIAFEYCSYYSNAMDLIQEGNIGLMKAVSKFDSTKGTKLSYYASWWIRSYILKYLLDNFRLVKIGTTQAQKKLFYHLIREKQRLEAQGFLANPKLLAEKFQVREKDVVEMEKRLGEKSGDVPLDAMICPENGKGMTYLDLIEDSNESAENRLVENELLTQLHEVLPEFETQLNEKEKTILKDRLLAEEPKTLQEVAQGYKMTRERARQIEARVIEKLRVFLKNWFDQRD